MLKISTKYFNSKTFRILDVKSFVQKYINSKISTKYLNSKTFRILNIKC